jgi:hypothetical protein
VFKSFVEELGYISLGVFLILVAIFVWRPNFNGQANGIGRGRDNEGGNKIL